MLISKVTMHSPHTPSTFLSQRQHLSQRQSGPSSLSVLPFFRLQPFWSDGCITQANATSCDCLASILHWLHGLRWYLEHYHSSLAKLDRRRLHVLGTSHGNDSLHDVHSDHTSWSPVGHDVYAAWRVDESVTKLLSRCQDGTHVGMLQWTSDASLS